MREAAVYETVQVETGICLTPEQREELYQKYVVAVPERAKPEGLTYQEYRKSKEAVWLPRVPVHKPRAPSLPTADQLKFKADYEAGIWLEDLSKTYGLTPKTIKKKAARMGARRPDWYIKACLSKPRKKRGPKVREPWELELKKDFEAGMFLPELAAKYGRSQSAVSNLAHRMGATRPYRRPCPRLDVYIAWLLAFPFVGDKTLSRASGLAVSKLWETRQLLGIPPSQVAQKWAWGPEL